MGSIKQDEYMSGIVELGVPEVPIFGILVSPILGSTDCIHHSTTLHFEYICTSLKDIFKDSFTSNLKILVEKVSFFGECSDQ